MPRKKEVILKNWDQVDEGLRRLGEIEIELGKIEGELTIKVNKAKEDADIFARGLKKEKKSLEVGISDFCDENKNAFLKKRSRDLTYGIVAYKTTKKIIIRSNKACVAAMEALKMEKYLRIEKKPDKELMLELDDGILAKIGASKKIEDRIRIEPAIEKIKDTPDVRAA